MPFSMLYESGVRAALALPAARHVVSAATNRVILIVHLGGTGARSGLHGLSVRGRWVMSHPLNEVVPRRYAVVGVESGTKSHRARPSVLRAHCMAAGTVIAPRYFATR